MKAKTITIPIADLKVGDVIYDASHEDNEKYLKVDKIKDQPDYILNGLCVMIVCGHFFLLKNKDDTIDILANKSLIHLL
jgi:hypothetical protein